MLTGAWHTDWSQFLNHNANWQQVTYTRMPNELSVSKQKLVAGSRIIILMHSTNLEIRFNTSKRHHIPDCYNDQLHMEPRSDSPNLKQSSLNRSKYKPIFYTNCKRKYGNWNFCRFQHAYTISTLYTVPNLQHTCASQISSPYMKQMVWTYPTEASWGAGA